MSFASLQLGVKIADPEKEVAQKEVASLVGKLSIASSELAETRKQFEEMRARAEAAVEGKRKMEAEELAPLKTRAATLEKQLRKLFESKALQVGPPSYLQSRRHGCFGRDVLRGVPSVHVRIRHKAWKRMARSSVDAIPN
eukprot:4658537-Pleurochrysis_carterae.AAC.1